MGQLQPTTIAKTLAGACNPGERRMVVNQLRETYGVTSQAIYKAAKAGGFISGRKKRSDAGRRDLPVTDEQLSAVAKIIHASHTEKGRIPMPAHQAIRLAEQHELIPSGVVNEYYLNEWMRKRNISKKHSTARKPHTRLMSTHPNHCHMIDASQCAQWYLKTDGTVGHQRRDLEVYKNKEGKPNKISRLLLVDHFSGAFFVRYVPEEDRRAWINFLYEAWADKSHLAESLSPFMDTSNISELFPFRGMPDFIYSDKGGPIIADTTQRVLDNLKIDYDSHKAGNPGAKGANETMQRHWERWFESGLKIKPAASLEELNAWAFETCVAINAERKHTRHKTTRFHAWRSNLKEIRDVPDFDFYRSYATTNPELRKVNHDGTLLFTPPGKKPYATSGVYKIPDVNIYGTRVEVSYCLYNYPQIKVLSRRTGQFFELLPLYRNGMGFIPEISATIGENFRSNPNTDSQNAFSEMGYVEKKGAYLPCQPIALEDVHKREPKPSVPLAPSIPILAFVPPEESEVRVYTRVEARRKLLPKLGADSVADLHPIQQQILTSIPHRITQPEFDSILADLLAVDPAEIISINGEAHA